MEPHKHLKRSIYVPGGVYHITSAVNNREAFFEEARYRFMFLRELAITSVLKNFDIIALALMPEHIHLIIRINEFSNSQIMHSVKRAVSREINLLEGVYVFRWQHSFYDRLLREENEFKAYFQYVLDNPSKHEMAGFTWSVAGNADTALTTSTDEPHCERAHILINERISLKRSYYRVKTLEERLDLGRSIAKMERKIDTLVYEIYGLNEEDI